MRSRFLVLFGVLGLVILNVNAFADEQSSTVKLESRYLTEQPVNIQAGDIAVTETNFSLTHEFKLQNEMPITISFQDKHVDLNSDVAVYLPSTLEGRSLGLGAKFPMPFMDSNEYFVGVDVFPSMYTDGWNENSSSAFRLPFRMYGIYKKSDNFILIGGVSIRPSFNTTVLPVIGFIYKPNEKVEFNFASDNPMILYKVSEATKIFWEGKIVNDEYEVTREGEKGRILLYNSLSTGVGVEQTFCKSFKALASVGSVFARSIRYEDDNGKVDPEAGMYVNARLTASF